VSTTGAPSAAGQQAAGPQRAPRLIPPDGPLSLDDHLARYGALPFSATPAFSATSASRASATPALIAELERSGLTGRGGAGFPAARKMRAVAQAGGQGGPFGSAVGTVVVANGAESEPASGKDRLLLTRAPHLVLDGIALAAEAVGATRAYLCVHGGGGAPELLLREAITHRERAGLNRVPIQVVAVPGGYVASQETALISFLNGGAARPTFVPPRPSDKGAHRRPTLVHNVETLAHIALIARYGAAWFREMGTPRAAGSALVTVGGAIRRPGVYEISLGTPVGDLLRRAGGPAEPVQAILAGGYFGGWLPFPAAQHIALSDEGLRPAGAAFGPGILILLPESACGLAETARVTGYLASHSAGQCGPCSNGLPALADAMEHIAFGQPARDALRWTKDLMTLVTGRGACHLPDGTAAIAASALRVFAGDLRRHAEHGPCARVRRAPMLPTPFDAPQTS
jgi:NADH:ubiquinone oxidoreductase subunit F (NADH-binding)